MKPDGTAHTPASGARAFLRDCAVALVALLVLRLVWEPLVGSVPASGSVMHPFWIVVVLSAAQGGLAVGIVTAAMATALMGWPERVLGTDILVYYADLAGTPLLWLLTAIVLGGYRRAQIGIEAALRAENTALHQDAEVLTDEINRLDEAVRRMELSAMTRLSAGDRAIAALADLGSSDADSRGEVLATAAALLTRQPGYVLRHGEATPVLQWGFPETYVPSDPGGAPGHGLLDRPVAGYASAVRQSFASGEVVILTEDEVAGGPEEAVAAVLAQALDRSLRAQRPAARIVRAVG